MGRTVIGGRKLKPARGCCAWALAGLLAFGCTSALADPPTAARGSRDLLILNTSARSIEQVYVSSSSSDQWGEDWLAGADVAPGADVHVAVPRASGCSVDVQVVYADAQREERRAVDMCHTRELAFDGRGATAPDGVVRDHVLKFANRERRPITQLFLSASDADQWGDSRLEGDPLGVGRSQNITYRGGCLADLRIVFDNRAAEERRGIDLCSRSGVIFRPGWTTDDRVPGDDAAPHGGAVAAATPAAIVTILVENRSGVPVTTLTLRPEDREPASALARDEASNETHDLLGGQLLPAGGHVVVPITRGSACRYTVHLVHGGGKPDQDVPGFDLCTMHELVIPPAAAVR